MDKTQTWLVDEVRIRTGMYFDRAYIWAICQGKRKPPFIVKTIKEILGIEDEEEQRPS